MLAGALLVVVIVGVAVVLMSGGGHSAAKSASATAASGVHVRTRGPGASTGATGVPSADGGSTTHAGGAGATGGAGQSSGLPHHQAAQAGGQGSSSGAHPKTSAGATVGADGTVAVAEVRDPEEAKSFPVPASVHHRAASTPSVAAEAAVAPGAASDAQVRKELGEEEHAKAQEQAARHRILTPVAGGFSVGGNGTIPIPSGVPEAVQRVVAGGNAIADFPYIWGGGHGSFVANGYDCSGSVSYALAAGGLLSQPLVSGDLASWGEPGPGHWITIYANAGHTFMDVNGVWFDTAGRSGPYASRWLVSTPSLAGYSVRHPPGL
jgi:cell wall-associated NlpC family hydrolase